MLTLKTIKYQIYRDVHLVIYLQRVWVVLKVYSLKVVYVYANKINILITEFAQNNVLLNIISQMKILWVAWNVIYHAKHVSALHLIHAHYVETDCNFKISSACLHAKQANIGMLLYRNANNVIRLASIIILKKT